VLDGGFDRWKAAGRPVTAEPTKIAPSVFHADFDAGRVASLADMRRIVDTGESQIADARGPGRFTGTEPEPRAGIRSAPAENRFELTRLDRAIKPCFDGDLIGSKNPRT